MGLFSRLTGSISAAAGTSPQIVRPTGWELTLTGGLVLQQPAFGAAITPDLADGNWIVVTATNNAAFAIQTPTYRGAALSAANMPPVGSLIVVTLRNNSGGVLGAFTMPGGVWNGAQGYVAPPNGQMIQSVWAVFSAAKLYSLTNWSTAIAF